MKTFINDQFLLPSETSRRLYHEFAASMPIIDYHCHLPPADIAQNRRFNNLSEVWLHGDHYKWRAMRTNGVSEDFCTGQASDDAKFKAWAATVPYTLRNPLYHWTHLELLRYFGIDDLLNAETADSIYGRANEMLAQPGFDVQGLLKAKQVEIVCTTDDPVDNLAHHQRHKLSGAGPKMFPAFRPDKAMLTQSGDSFRAYVRQVETASNQSIHRFDDYLAALKQRHQFFHDQGCRLSDHGLETMFAADYTLAEMNRLFDKLMRGGELTADEQYVFGSGMLHQFALWDHEKGWVQQFHLGALRNNNGRLLKTLGPDTGWDSIGDFAQALPLARFLNRLDEQDQLTKTILYNLNPADNALMATMIGNFQDGSVAGKIQWGSAWWFLDQKKGMADQLNELSNMGLLSRFVGMLTDSRSFLSFPRHEYFRRLLCQLLGAEMEAGELPMDLPWIGSMVQDISYRNNRQYFPWQG